jgi:hypothetical protein
MSIRPYLVLGDANSGLNKLSANRGVEGISGPGLFLQTPEEPKFLLPIINLSVLEVLDLEEHGAGIVRGDHLLAVAPQMDLRFSGLDRDLGFPNRALVINFQFRIDSATFDGESARVARISDEPALELYFALGGTGVGYQNLPLSAAPVPILRIVPLPWRATGTHFCFQRVKGAIITAGLGCRAAF